jgi:hypothetical protein
MSTKPQTRIVLRAVPATAKPKGERPQPSTMYMPATKQVRDADGRRVLMKNATPARGASAPVPSAVEKPATKVVSDHAAKLAALAQSNAAMHKRIDSMSAEVEKLLKQPEPPRIALKAVPRNGVIVLH